MAEPKSALHRLSLVATSNHGVFSLEVARKLGINDHRLMRLERQGVIARLSPRAGRFVGAPSTWRHRVAAACAALGDFAVAGYRTAAALHRLDGWSLEPEPIEIVVPRSERNRRVDLEGVVVRSSNRLRPEDRTWVDRIPVTTVEWTLARLGRFTTSARVEESLDVAERDQRTNQRDVERTLAAVRGRGVSGVADLSEAIERRNGIAGTPRGVLGRRLARLLVAAGLPGPVLEYPVMRRDGAIAYLDGAYPACLVGLEADDHASHSTRSQRASDHRRQNMLELDDFHMLRFTYEQIHGEAGYVVGTVAAALEKWGGYSFPTVVPPLLRASAIRPSA
jgi:hypothetical protein